MFHFISKAEYFNALDVPEIDHTLAPTRNLGLKHIQMPVSFIECFP